MSARDGIMIMTDNEDQNVNGVEHIMQTAQRTGRITTGRLVLGCLSFLLLLASVPAWADVDLVMTNVDTTTTSVPVNGTIVVNTTVKNQGTTATTATSYVGIYLSADATITSADMRLGTAYPPALAAGASSTASTSIPIPISLAPGTYYVGAIADVSNTQAETDETNNALGGTSFTVVRDVDLVMTNVSTTATSVQFGNSFALNTTVKNQGTTTATTTSYLGIYLSTDANITTADTRVTTVATPILAAGASSTLSTNITIPTNMVAPGTYYVGAIADFSDAQPENNETNNAMATVATITVVPNIDLIMMDVSTTATSLPINGTATVSNTIKNQGTVATTASSSVGIYLSIDATITTADTLIGSRTVSSLAAGASSTATTNITVPTLAPGTYYIGTIADYLGQQGETNETNNALAAAATVVITDQPPTVSLTSPANNATATAPASFTLTANAADSDGTIAKVEFYQGTTLLGTVTASPYSYTWNNVAAGSYSLTAVATDNYGVQTTSAAVSVTVNSGVAQAYYIHTDQLDTPRVITDTNGNVVWQWDNSDPFGNNSPNENPTGAGQFNFNLRFAGQYFDRETNTHQNYFRDYDPSIGRYLSSDPIGLGGGVNTFTYVGANPLSFIDPNGLSGCKWVGPVLVCDFNPPPAGITGDPNIDAAINGGSASQSSSASSSSTDSSGAKVSPGAQCMQPPGNCSPQDQKQLQNEVDEACRQPRACKPGMDQITIQVNVSNGLRCALARNRINNKCFAGGDTNHRNEAIRVWGTVANCQGMAQ